jgi:hypothetical protein
MVVTTGVSTSALYVNGRKSKPLWMMSRSPACSKAAAMWRASATFGSIVSSSFHPCGDVLRRTAVVIESPVANSVTSCPAATSPSASREANSSQGP